MGDVIEIPSEKFSAIIHKLWSYKLFSDINIYIKKVEGDTVFLELAIRETPSLVDVKISGVSQKKGETLLKECRY